MKPRAFPYEDKDYKTIDPGMTIEDYFAAKAMQAILTGSAWGTTEPNAVAAMAYRYAKAMTEERRP